MNFRLNVESKPESSITNEIKQMIASNFSLNSISSLSSVELFDLPNEGEITFYCIYVFFSETININCCCFV